MNKPSIINQIYEAVDFYEQSLKNKKLLILYGHNANNPESIECLFLNTNFKHLTGIDNNDPPLVFYKKCLNRRLSEEDIIFKKDNTTEIKISVLKKTLQLFSNGKMIGIYDDNRMYLQTDKLIGGVNSCLGFILDNNDFYYPNTLIKGDIRHLCSKGSVKPINAILRKDIKADVYEEICYVSKRIGNDFSRININKLDKNIKIQIPIPIGEEV